VLLCLCPKKTPSCEGKLKCWVGACALFVKKKEKPPRSTNQKNTKSNAIGFVCATPSISNLWYYFFNKITSSERIRNKNLTPFPFYNFQKENNVLWMVSIILYWYNPLPLLVDIRNYKKKVVFCLSIDAFFLLPACCFFN
jgi:hypothetical protein